MLNFIYMNDPWTEWFEEERQPQIEGESTPDDKRKITTDDDE